MYDTILQRASVLQWSPMCFSNSLLKTGLFGLLGSSIMKQVDVSKTLLLPSLLSNGCLLSNAFGVGL